SVREAGLGGDDLRWLPGASAIETAPEQHIDLPRISAAVPPSFAEGEDRAGSGGHQRGDAIGVMVTHSSFPQVDCGLALVVHGGGPLLSTVGRRSAEGQL